MQSTRTLEITGMAYGGRGVARAEGKVYFVSGALPGDVVEAKILSDKKKFAEADVVRFVRRSETHRQAPCPYVPRCGGCHWQEADESLQRTWKKDFVRQTIKKFAGYELPDDFILHASPEDFSYRNRIQLKLKTDAAGKLSIGYFGRASHELVAITHCMIAAPTINTWLNSFTQSSRVWPKNAFAELEIQEVPQRQKLLFTLRASSDQPMASALREEVNASPLMLAVADQDSKTYSFVEYDQQRDLRFYTAAALFQQVNRRANHSLRERVLELVGEIRPRNVFDVFCGSGNLSLPLAKQGISVLGVEKSTGAIAAARHNVQENNIKNATYLNEDAAALANKMLRQKQTFDLIMVDPPRAGLMQTVTPLIELKPKHFLYLSCDPNTLARDLHMLRKNCYEITNIEAFDFFPQTYHVETLVVLKKT